MTISYVHADQSPSRPQEKLPRKIGPLGRVRRAGEQLWYGPTLAREWVAAPTDASSEEGRHEALGFAARSYERHSRVAKRAHVGFIVFQVLTIGAAATATVLNVSASVGDVARAIPSAIAAVSATVVATFHFRATWLRHRAAVSAIETEQLNFRLCTGPYGVKGPSEHTDIHERERAGLFIARIVAISRRADTEENETPHAYPDSASSTP